MANLNEYKIEIRNDEDFYNWKRSWDKTTPPPQEVVAYFKRAIAPKMIVYAREQREMMEKLSNENKRNN